MSREITFSTAVKITPNVDAAVTLETLKDIPHDAILLSHHDDGLIWGKAQAGKLNLSGKIDSLPQSTLQQARFFWKEGEVFIWRDGDGHLQARRIEDKAPTDKNGIVGFYDESQILWGDTAQDAGHGWTRMTDGAQGLAHTVPLDISNTKQGVRPLRLKVRHYLKEHDDTGALYVAVSRLVSLEAK